MAEEKKNQIIYENLLAVTSISFIKIFVKLIFCCILNNLHTKSINHTNLVRLVGRSVKTSWFIYYIVWFIKNSQNTNIPRFMSIIRISKMDENWFASFPFVNTWNSSERHLLIRILPVCGCVCTQIYKYIWKWKLIQFYVVHCMIMIINRFWFDNAGSDCMYNECHIVFHSYATSIITTLSNGNIIHVRVEML